MAFNPSVWNFYLIILIAIAVAIGVGRYPRSVFAERRMAATVTGSALFSVGLMIAQGGLVQHFDLKADLGLSALLTAFFFTLAFCGICLVSWIARRVIVWPKGTRGFISPRKKLDLEDLTKRLQVWVANAVAKSNDSRVSTLVERMHTNYPHLSSAKVGFQDALVGMDAQGSHLLCATYRYRLGYYSELAVTEYNVADLVSADLSMNTVTQVRSTTKTKKKGTLTRAVAGSLVAGPVGALVGASSAGSKGTTTGTERKVFQSCDLLIGTRALSQPVLRFRFASQNVGEDWLHRIRAAMANATSAAPSLVRPDFA